jgi:Kdo2-lipid IVA lauroyltransferase/acyltransferase
MFFIRLLSRLPLWVLYRISDVLFVVSFYVVRYRRKMVWKNMKNSFPEKTDQEIKAIARQFYRNLCDYGVEMLKLVTISEKELLRRTTFKNPEVVRDYLKRGQSMLYLTSHQFNWEWGLVSACLVYPAQMDFVYQAVNSKFFNELSLQTRSRFGGYGIKRDEVARETVKRKGILKGVSIMADQYPGYGHDKKYLTTFLHQDTVFFYGSNQLGVLTQWPVIYHQIRRVRRGHYEVTCVEIAKPPYEKNSSEIIENYVRAMEKSIRDYPANWLWSHNRWKRRHLDEGTASIVTAVGFKKQ